MSSSLALTTAMLQKYAKSCTALHSTTMWYIEKARFIRTKRRKQLRRPSCNNNNYKKYDKIEDK